ncbi:hypothetical protein DFH06DRAFT_1472541, partial [Mycena polygramma]
MALCQIDSESLSSGIPSAMQPKLPLDLERHIFELAAFSRPVSMPTMIRVSYRVKNWIEPLLYRTLVFGARKIDGLPICDYNTFNRIVDTKPQLLVSVRNVMALLIGQDTVKDIIRRCHGLENLVALPCDLWSGQLPPPGFDELSLRRLHCDLDAFCNLRSVATLAVQPLLHLTHLALFSEIDSGCVSPAARLARWNLLAAVPNLTHLAVNGQDQLPMCSHLLTGCGFLAALIALSPVHPPGSPELEVICNELRFVMMSLDMWTNDWLNGVLGVSTSGLARMCSLRRGYQARSHVALSSWGTRAERITLTADRAGTRYACCSQFFPSRDTCTFLFCANQWIDCK